MEELTALNWISDLHSRLGSVQCKLNGQPASMSDGLRELETQLKNVRERGRFVWWVGNGGSAALCSHLSQDLMNKLGIRSMVLTDPALLTCMANDYGYTKVYEKPLSVLSQKGDLLIAISSSGKSENILSSARLAQQRGAELITLSGFEDRNPLWQMPATVAFYMPSSLYGQVEVGHETILHAAIEALWLKEKNKERRGP